MALRIDPACPDLRQLQSAHAREFRRMVDDPTTKLALILRERHDREVTAHAQACFRCEHHLPPCKGCGRDLRQRAHGWMCSEKPGR